MFLRGLRVRVSVLGFSVLKIRFWGVGLSDVRVRLGAEDLLEGAIERSHAPQALHFNALRLIPARLINGKLVGL